ncbi:alpha/beta hydrolase [Nocardioides zeae]|nr:alpha/beta hydrolase [Nocardioides zeae]
MLGEPAVDPYLDVQYNARASVTDFEARMRLYRRLSDEAYAAVPHVEAWYGEGDGELLDVFVQPARSAAPVFVFIHGGYWRALSKEDSAFVSPMLHAAGAVVVTLDYALAPAVSLSHIVDQVRRAIAWIHRNIDHFGGDPQRIVVSGSSAGGHLTGMVLAAGWHTEYGVRAEAIIGALPLSGLFDVRPLLHTHINGWMGLDLAAATENSPSLHLPERATTPIVACYGALETAEFAAQTRGFVDAWAGRGGPATLHAVRDRDHFSVVIELTDADSLVGRAALHLLGLGPHARH